jgi:alkanesulfonate monooxygenase SsuD/methylene tetrahydromethanopterin reductase-like flavin-dependent oxidoreductase (luciferase family)
MRVGVVLFMQNHGDWPRFRGGDFGGGPAEPDHRVVEDELRLAELVEPLGFDSLWSIEHHFTPYTMVPDPLQFLAWCAARTRRVSLGTCVVVLPWHDPVRVAEQIALLDILAGGREIAIGFGRGAGRREFDGFRVPMSEARERFSEALDIVRLALSQERFSYAGKHHRIPETGIRPRPRTPDLTSRMYAAAISPSSVELMAEAGLGMLIIPQKTWQEHAQDLAAFNAVRSRKGLAKLRSKVVVFVYCSESAADGEARGLEYIGNYQDTAIWHYELDEPHHFHAAPGYEYYARGADVLKKLGATGQVLAREHFARAHVYGTPEQCLDKLASIRRMTDADEFICVFRCGGMPVDEAEASMRLFARAVLPALQARDGGPAVPAGR